MKPKTTFFILAILLMGLMFFTPAAYAQQKSDEQSKAKKTITIHVTKDVNGNAFVIDTTVVTDGDFDADTFLKERGVINDSPNDGKNAEKHIIIRHPKNHEFGWSDSRSNRFDTISINDEQVFIFKDNHALLAPPLEGMPLDFDIDMQRDFYPRQGPQFDDMLQGMAKTFGIENVMPFGEMKQVVVKKKRNGKKVIITFEDRKNEGARQEQSMPKKKKKL